MSEATTTDLVAFITARLDEDEAAARAATPGRWAAGGSPGAEYLPRDHVHAPDYRPEGFSKGQHVGDASVADGGMGPWAVRVSGSGFPLANATHIARHDPARSLREVRILREVVADLSVLAGLTLGVGPEMARLMLRKISGIWDDHADYRPWLPVLAPEVPRS